MFILLHEREYFHLSDQTISDILYYNMICMCILYIRVRYAILGNILNIKCKKDSFSFIQSSYHGNTKYIIVNKQCCKLFK